MQTNWEDVWNTRPVNSKINYLSFASRNKVKVKQRSNECRLKIMWKNCSSLRVKVGRTEVTVMVCMVLSLYGFLGPLAVVTKKQKT